MTDSGLSRVLRSLLGVTFMLVLLFPFAATAEALLVPSGGVLDAGAQSVASRTVLEGLILLGALLRLLLPSQVQVGDRSGRWTTRLLAIFLAVWGAASLTSVCVPDSLQVWLIWLCWGLFMAVSRDVASTFQSFELIVHCLIAVGGLVVGFGLAALMSPTSRASQAFVGAFYQADVAAGYVILLAPVAVGLLIGARRWRPRVLYALVSVLLTTSLVLTYSRGGQISLCIGFVAAAVLMWRVRGAMALAIPVGVLLLSIALSGLIASHGEQLISPRTVERTRDILGAGKTDDTSVAARIAFWRGAWRLARARPLLGWGPGTYGRTFPHVMTDVRYYSKYAHSAYATIGAEGGVLSLLAFLLFVGAAVFSALQQYRGAAASLEAGAPGASRRLAAISGIIGALLAGLSHILIDVDWEFPLLPTLFFGLTGLIMSNGASGASELSIDASLSPPTFRLRLACFVPLAVMAASLCFPWLSDLNHQMAMEERANKHLDSAIAAQRRAVDYMPFSATAWQTLAEMLLETDARDKARSDRSAAEAVEAARTAVHLDPDRAVNHEVMARALAAAGDMAGEEKAMEIAVRCDPLNYPRFYNVLAELDMRRSRPQRALQVLRETASRFSAEVFAKMWSFRRASLNDQLSETWYLIGMLEQMDKKDDDAMRAFATALNMSPTNIGARFQLGTLQMNCGRPDLAYEQFYAIARLKPSHCITQWLLGLCYREFGQLVRSTELLRQAYRQDAALSVARSQVTIPADFFTVPTPVLPASGEP